jgi:hypothetical protein
MFFDLYTTLTFMANELTVMSIKRRRIERRFQNYVSTLVTKCT